MKTYSRFFSVVALVAAFSLFAAPQPAQAADDHAGHYNIDVSHSTILFKVKHLGISWSYGRFNDFSGSLVLDDDPSKISVEFEVKTASVDTANQKRDDHLRNPDFFDAKTFPVMTFKSKSVQAKDDNSYEVKGDLMLHGVTKEITIEVEETGKAATARGDFRVGAETKFKIKRSDFGINYMLSDEPGKGLGDEVTVMIAIEAIRKDKRER